MKVKIRHDDYKGRWSEETIEAPWYAVAGAMALAEMYKMLIKGL